MEHQPIHQTLSADAIDRISAEIDAVCREYGMDQRTILRYRLSAEESLSIWRSQLGADAQVHFELGKKFFQKQLIISVDGKNCNPYNVADEQTSFTGKNLLAGIGLLPTFYYHREKNHLAFAIQKKPMNPILLLLLVILGAAMVGIGGNLLMPAQTVDFLQNSLVTPIEDAFFRILSAIAGPMIFLSVAWGVYGIGDVYTLGRIGKKLILSFFSVVLVFSILGVATYPFLGSALSEAAAQNSQFDKIFSLLLSIFPSNIFEPFIQGNTLQIIFLAFVVGLSLIFLGQRTASVARAVEQINQILQFLMGFVSKLVPYFVFVVLVRIFWSRGFAIFASVWQFAACYLAADAVLILAFICYVSLRDRINPIRMLKTCMPSFLVALTTASSAATFESNISICQKKMGIQHSLSSFSVPFGMVLFKPTTALYYLVMCFYLSAVNGVTVSTSWIVIAVISTAVLAVSTPPIPGGSVSTYTMLFLQLGIPTEALAIALAVDMLFDFVMTSGDMLCLLGELFHVSGKLGMRDKNAPILQK